MNLKNKTFILFGGTGLIGSYFTKEFIESNLAKKENNNHLVIIDKNPLKIIPDKNINFEFIQKDINKLTKKDIKKLIKTDDLIILNLAAILGVKNVLESNDYMSSEMTLQLKIKSISDILKNEANVDLFMYFSSSEAYGHQFYMKEDNYSQFDSLLLPTYIRERYGLSKFTFEYLFKEAFPENFISVRPFNVTGIYQDKNFVIPKMINDALTKNKITVYGGNQIRHFIHGKDFSKALFKIIENRVILNNSDNKILDIINVANIKNRTKILELAYKIKKIIKKRLDREIEIETIDTDDYNIIGHKDRPCDLNQLYFKLKFQPQISLNEIINEFLDYYVK